MADEISVILPYYNRQDTLAEAVTSVLQQTHLNLRLFLVDDGSTDGSAGLVRALPDPRIVHLEASANGGASRARNLGLEASTTSLVAFMDSDDRWDPTKLQRQLQFLRDLQQVHRDVAVVGCGWRYFDQAVESRSFEPGPYTRTEFLRGTVAGTGTPLLLVDRAVAAHAMFDPTFLAFEEGDYVLKCLLGERRLAILPKVLVDVRRGRTDHVANRRSAAVGYERLLQVYATDYAREPTARSWFSFRACREYLCLRSFRAASPHLAEALRMERLRRGVHLLLSASMGPTGASIAQRLLPVVHPGARERAGGAQT
jgi:teichuronic acid biosynthesis glycosyltransferase TuaG